MPLRSRYPCSQKARVPGLLAAQGHEQANGSEAELGHHRAEFAGDELLFFGEGGAEG